LTICDKCGWVSEQDNIINEYELAVNLKFDLHRSCVDTVRDRFRMSIGLKTNADIDKMVKNGRYLNSIPSQKKDYKSL